MTRYFVLLYHGVHSDDLELGHLNTSGKHMAQRRFAREMRHIKANFPIVRMTDIAAAYRGEKTLPEDAVAVTFDDGFHNNLTHALPVLEEFQVPATFYLATGFIGTGKVIWTDRLEAALVNTRGSGLCLHLGEEDEFESGTPFVLADPADRLKALYDIKLACKKLPNAEKDRVVAEVEVQTRSRAAADHPLYRFLDWDDVRQMAKSPLVDIGAHTVDHVSLTKVTPGEMRWQISLSISAVAKALDGPCSLFSYPEGQASDYNDEAIAHLKWLGLDHAPSAIHGENDFPKTDPFHIRRIMPGFYGRTFPFEHYDNGGSLKPR